MWRPGSRSIEAFKRARHLRDSRHNVTSVTSCEHISSFSCHLCRWRTKAVCCRLKKKSSSKVGSPSAEQPDGSCLFGRRGLFFKLSYFYLFIFIQILPWEKRRGGGHQMVCERGEEGEKNSGKLNVTSHVTNWIASNRKSVAIASDKPLSRETAGTWQTREHLKGTEAFGC